MAVLISKDLPLEKMLEQQATDRPQAFPNRGINFFNRYVEIKQHLAEKYYQVTGAGLSSGGQRFTKHDIYHVDDVIKREGRLLGVGEVGDLGHSKLEPFEVFLLLYGTALHDAGNAYERAGHEVRVHEIIQNMGELCPLVSAERLFLGQIAQAHGGKTKDNDKDTITRVIGEDVSHFDNVPVHGRRLAALLRIADELSENPRRADERALESPDHPSYLPNFYCTTINDTIDALSKSASLNYTIKAKDLNRKHKDPERNNKATYIVDYIAKRIEKCDLERRYCNRFLSGFAEIRSMRANLRIFSDKSELLTEIPIDLSDRGYPTLDRGVAKIDARFTGVKLKREYCRPKAHATRGAA